MAPIRNLMRFSPGERRRSFIPSDAVLTLSRGMHRPRVRGSAPDRRKSFGPSAQREPCPWLAPALVVGVGKETALSVSNALSAVSCSNVFATLHFRRGALISSHPDSGSGGRDAFDTDVLPAGRAVGKEETAYMAIAHGSFRAARRWFDGGEPLDQSSSPTRTCSAGAAKRSRCFPRC